jgi:hypothetical protein
VRIGNCAATVNPFNRKVRYSSQKASRARANRSPSVFAALSLLSRGYFYIMAVAAAELVEPHFPEETKERFLYAVPDVPDTPGESPEPMAYPVQEAEYEPETQERFQRWVGSLTMPSTTESISSEDEPGDTNLLEMLRLAKAGNSEALKLVTININTATAEACFKDGHVTDVYMQRNESGQLMQFGQSMDSVHRNSITMRPNRHPKLKRITQAEALNGHRIEDALEAGQLKDHYFVVVSMIPEGVPEKELGADGDGYFLDGLTYVVQATSELNSSKVKTESAFMAGVDPEEGDSFEDRMDKRFDIRVVSKVYERLRLEPPSSVAEFLENGIYISKTLMPNGVVDFMRWCAEAKDELLGRQIDHKPEDHREIILESKRREASLEGARQNVLNDLLSRVEELSNPMEAVQLIWKLVKKHTTEDSFTNMNIDPKVFGKAAEPYINVARHLIQTGRKQMAQAFMQKAHARAVITGCGGGSSEAAGGRDKFGPLKFSCPKGHPNERPPNTLIPCCTTCGISVKC